MKKHFLLFVLILLSKLLSAQDTILKINGDVIYGKIIEINPAEIKYKKSTFLDGPTYVENKSDVKTIKYSSGLKEEITSTEIQKTAPPIAATTDYYNPNEARVSSNKMEPYGSRYKFEGRKIGEREMQSILMKTNNREIISNIQMAKDAQKLQYVGFGAIPLGIAALYFLSASLNNSSTGYLATSAIMVCGAISCPIISGINKHKRNASNRRAVEIYNQKY